jgi:succinate-semialdehyde dehydrogenase/glutarate-semialdehyde dehydrogenase
MKSFQSKNPATGAEINSYEPHSTNEVRRRVTMADKAQKKWAVQTFEQRGGVMTAVAAELRREKEDLARLMVIEMGKPVTQARAEIEKCAATCDYYAAETAKLLASENISSDAAKSFICFQPLGVILGIMPWNFPFFQVFRAAVPALMAGNAFLLKHASNVTGCSLAIEEVFRRGGLPVGLFNALLIDGQRARRLIANPAIRGITLTGSTSAGRAVAAAAGRAIKKSVLELGGSDASVVLADADVARAAEICAKARLINTGQSCIAAKRFIVERPVLEEFLEHFLKAMSKKMGDPLDDATEVGPLARLDLREELHQQVKRSVAAGARLVLGGQIDEGSPGAFYPPTVLAGVKPGMAAFDEETFGPAAAVIEAKDEDDAVELANLSSFGLGASIFTRDLERGERIAATKLQAGSCFVNDFVRSDPRFPFGGVKDSGYGRELSYFGLREFVNVKTVWVKG